MSYSVVLNTTDNFEENYMCVVSPKRRVVDTDFSLDAGSVYVASFDYGFISDVLIDGVALTSASNSSLSAGEYYYDHANENLYIRMSDSGAPASTDFIIATYELYFATQDFQWYRDPLDTNSQATSFQAFLKVAPYTTQTYKDLLQGFIPTTITNMSIDNHEHTLERHLYDSSFYLAKVQGWHIVDTTDALSTGNIKKVFDGFIETFSYSQGSVTFNIADISQELNKEFRSSQSSYSDFLNTSEFSGLDSKAIGKAKRRVFGIVYQMEFTNVNYSTTVSASTNNQFLVARKIDMQGADTIGNRGLIDFTADVDTGTTGAGSVTRIYFTDSDFVQNFTVGEEIIVYPNSTVWSNPPDTDYNSYRTAITALGANYIDIGTARNVTGAGQLCARLQVPVVYAIQDQTVTQLHPFRDYYIDTEQDMFKIVLDSNYVTSASLGSAISNINPVFGNVFGYNTGDSETWAQVTTNGARLIKYLLTQAGIPSGRINSTSFTNFESAYDEILGFVVPFKSSSHKKYKDIIKDILSSIRARLYVNSSNEYVIGRIAKFVSADDTIVDDDIELNSFKMSTDYTDIVDTVRVNYKIGERSTDPNVSGETTSVSTSTNNLARYLHGITKEMNVDTLLYLSSEASSYATFLANIFGDRSSTFELNVDRKYFDSLIDDDITIQREKLPGFAYTEGTNRTRNTKVISVEKGLKGVKLILDDQKGLEDN